MNVGSKFTRRGVLKSMGVLAVTGGLLGCSNGDDEEIRYVGDGGGAAKIEESVTKVVCRQNCFGFCYIDALVRNGKAVKFSRAEMADPDYNRICLKGLSAAQNLYSPQRLLYPMIRDNNVDRGKGGFKRATWDEALKYIAEKMNRIIADSSLNGGSSIAKWQVSGNLGTIQGNSFNRLFSILGASTISAAVDNTLAYGLARTLGMTITVPYM